MNWMKEVKIKGFRGIATWQKLKLAIPDNTNNGSGLTVLVGPNGGGKSSFLEMMLLVGNNDDNITLSSESRNTKSNNKVVVRIKYTEAPKTEFNNDRSVYQLSRVPESDSGNMAGKIYSVPSRRQLEKTFSLSKAERSNYSQESTKFKVDRNEFSRPVTRLVDLAEKADAKKDFDSILTEVLGTLLSWEVDHGQAGFYFKITAGSGVHDSSGLGFGIISLMFILDSVRDLGEGDIVIIDEPELSQHPAVQRRLAKLLSEKSAQNQIIIATHSPYFADVSALNKGTEIARIASSNRYGTQVFQMDEDTKISLVKLMTDLNNPHTIGLEAKEVLFLDEGVILTEGQDDVLLLPKLAAQVNKRLSFSLYGWGVGGADKMKTICSVLNGLGLKKVIGLVDKDKYSVFRAIKKQFPKYKFFLLPADDIRDKKGRKAIGKKDGVSSSKGNLHPVYKDSFTQLIDDINSAYK